MTATAGERKGIGGKTNGIADIDVARAAKTVKEIWENAKPISTRWDKACALYDVGGALENNPWKDGRNAAMDEWIGRTQDSPEEFGTGSRYFKYRLAAWKHV